MFVVDSDQAAGRRYKCPCGVYVWSTWGNARKHSHVCPQAWNAGAVPDDHSDVRSHRGRAACPVCGRDVAYQSYNDGPHTERQLARHKNTGGDWCPARRWKPEQSVSGQREDGSFFYELVGR
jgi:hypothetical protein